MKSINTTRPAAEAKLTAELDAVQARSRARTITAAEILAALDEITAAIPCPKKALDGSCVWVDLHAQIYPGAYHGRPESTQFVAENRRGAWHVIKIERAYTGGTRKRYTLRLSDAAKKEILCHYSAF